MFRGVCSYRASFAELLSLNISKGLFTASPMPETFPLYAGID